MDIKTNTILGMNLFANEFKESLLFHIPHSKTDIPEQFKNDFVNDYELIQNEINLLTDFATDEIFTIKYTTKIVFPYSRIFCDVERLNDEDEIMFKVGRGFYYTKTDNGKQIRLNENSKDLIYKEYYIKHHNDLIKIVNEKIESKGFVTIIDCHSFSDKPFKTDLEQKNDRPDFCLGTDEYHTPKWLVDFIYNGLISLGYSVEINYPYSGTIIPITHYRQNDNVYSIMVEVNRKLYMDENYIVDNDKILILNDIFTKMLYLNEI
jgi:N-formylglutamate deformylase